MAFAAVSAGISLLQFSQKRSAAKIERAESETAALQVEVGATQRETDRTERLARALASQTATTGSRGISAFEGSPLAVLEADLSAAETAQERDTFQSELEAMTTRSRAGVRARTQRQGATIGLIGDLSQTAENVPSFNKKA